MLTQMLRGACAAAIVVVCAVSVPALAGSLDTVGAASVRGTNLAERCFTYAQARNGSYNALDACDRAFRGSLTRRDRTATFVNRAIVRTASGDVDGALDDLDRALTLDPDSPAAHAGRGELFVKLARWRDAEAEFTRAIDLGPALPHEAYFGRAVAREGAGDVEGAYADYQTAARLAPEWAAPREQLERFEVTPARPIAQA